MCEQLDLQFWR